MDMKRESIFFTLLVSFAAACTSDNQSKDGLSSIDVGKNYPVKEIILTDIADVMYVHLNTNDDDYLYKGCIRYETENTLVVPDEVSGSILFFSKDGSPKSRFNRYGSGPQEYVMKGRELQVIYDESADDVFVRSNFVIQVYSSMGEYKRTLKLPHGTSPLKIVDFDDQSLFLYDQSKHQYNNFYKMFGKEKYFVPHYDNDSSYFHISKTDGKIPDYLIFPSNEIDMTELLNDGSSVWHHRRNMKKHDAGVFLCHSDIDTVFLYGKDRSLTPVFCKTPLVSDMASKAILYNFMEVEKYQFFCVCHFSGKIGGDYKYYFRDKQTGEIFRQKIILPDYKGEDFSLFDNMLTFSGNEAVTALGLSELKKAYRENRLSGQLKELVATLNEEKDNDVNMLIRFK